MFDLTTSYLDLRLPSPLLASSSPLTGQVDALAELEEAGVGAVVLPSLFEEQLDPPSLARLGLPMRVPKASSEHVLPRFDDYNAGIDGYLLHVEAAREALGIPVIASLNGSTPDGWVGIARAVEDAGADAIELNPYAVVADPSIDANAVDEQLVELVSSVTDEVDIPVAVKLSPYHSALANLAERLDEAGAAGLVLFNRFYQPDIDLQVLDVSPRLSFSTSADLLPGLRWAALLHTRVEASIALTTGVHTSDDVLKGLLAGADVVMMASALLANGPAHVRTVLHGLIGWMERHGHNDLSKVRGAVSQRAVSDPMAYERANYLRTMASHASRFR